MKRFVCWLPLSCFAPRRPSPALAQAPQAGGALHWLASCKAAEHGK